MNAAREMSPIINNKSDVYEVLRNTKGCVLSSSSSDLGTAVQFNNHAPLAWMGLPHKGWQILLAAPKKTAKRA